MERSKSRRKTQSEGITDLNTTQTFLKEHYIGNYKERHRKIADCNESDKGKSQHEGKYADTIDVLYIEKVFCKQILVRYRSS